MHTIQDGREHIALNISTGTICPCCDQYVKMYNYKLYDTSAMALIKLYKLTTPTETEFHVNRFAEATPTTPRASHFAELRFWGFVEKGQPVKGKKSSGFWSITDKGKQFVEGKISVQQSILMFNNQFYGHLGPEINIYSAIGSKFTYDQIMRN